MSKALVIGLVDMMTNKNLFPSKSNELQNINNVDVKSITFVQELPLNIKINDEYLQELIKTIVKDDVPYSTLHNFCVEVLLAEYSGRINSEIFNTYVEK